MTGKPRVVALILVLGAAAACRTRNDAALKDAPALASEAPGATAAATASVFDYRVAGPSVPPSGRSLFDQLFADPGDGHAPSKVVVPYPFEKIVERIRSTGYAVDGVLIPRGRSLQRNAAKPDYFKFPRAVITPLPTDEQAGDLPATTPDGRKPRLTPLSGRLFIGFVEPAKQLEVISYNESLGRFEFQVVKNYGEGLNPKVFYAERSLCVACHQGQAPIFPINPWFETNETDEIGQLISLERGGSETYLGVPILDSSPDIAAFDAMGAFGRASRLDDMVREANDLAVAQTIWNEGCGRDAPASVKCRRNLLLSALTLSDLLPQPDAIAEEALIAANMKSYYPPELLGPHLTLLRPSSRFNPISAILAPGLPGQTPLDHIRKSVGDLTDLSSISPLVQRNLVTSDSFASSFQHVFHNAHASEIPFKFVPLAKITKALDDVVAAQGANTDGLFGGRFQPRALVAALGQALGEPVVPSRLGDADWTHLEAAQAEPPPPGVEAGSDPRIRPFRQYCSRCHTDEPLPTFMRGSDADVLASLKVGAAGHLKRIDWDSSPSGIMPPKSSAEYKTLALPEHEAERAAMLVFLAKIGHLGD